MESETFAALAQRIRSRRIYGEVVMHWTPEAGSLEDLANPVHVIDRFVASLGLHPIGTHWRELTREAALSAATAVVWRDLAYRAETMPHSEAAAFAVELLQPFHIGARFFTNHLGQGWTPITDHTFDAAIVAISVEGLLLFCVADED